MCFGARAGAVVCVRACMCIPRGPMCARLTHLPSSLPGTKFDPDLFVLPDYASVSDVSDVVEFWMVATPNGGPSISTMEDHHGPHAWRSGPKYESVRRRKFARMRKIMDHVFVRAKTMPGATDLERAKAAALAMDPEVKTCGRSCGEPHGKHWSKGWQASIASKS